LKLIEAQNSELNSLRQVVLGDQQQWRLEREDLHNQLTQQAFQIDRLQADLANANSLVTELSLRKESAPIQPDDRAETASSVHQDSVATPNTRGRGDTASQNKEASNPSSSNKSLGLSGEAQVAATDRADLGGCPKPHAAAPSAENGFRASKACLMDYETADRAIEENQSVTSAVQTEWKDDVASLTDADAAQRETIGSVEAVISTVVWRALRADTTDAELADNGLASTAADAARVEGQDQSPGAMANLDECQPEHRGLEESQARVELCHQNRAEQSQPSQAQKLLVGGLVALIVSLVAAAGVAGSWIWNR
jgi:hypothetical protein